MRMGLPLTVVVWSIGALCADVAGATPPDRDTILVVLKAGPDAELASIEVDRRPPLGGADMVRQLQEVVKELCRKTRDADQEDPEVILRIDDKLSFAEVAKVIRAVSRITDGKETVWLSTSIRLQTENFSESMVGQGYREYRDMRGRDRLKMGLDTQGESP
jgi:hypothetical protein